MSIGEELGQYILQTHYSKKLLRLLNALTPPPDTPVQPGIIKTRRARQARHARHDALDTSYVSCRDVTQQVEFGL